MEHLTILQTLLAVNNLGLGIATGRPGMLPNTYKMAPHTKNYPVPNVNSAEIKKPSSTQNSRLTTQDLLTCSNQPLNLGDTTFNFLKCLSESESHSVVSDSLRTHRLYSPWNSPDQNTGVGSLSLLQEIFPNQESNPDLPHCRWILYQLSQEGSPRILEWVAYAFSRGSSRPRNRTRVSCVAGRFFTNWAMRDAPLKCLSRAF